MIVLKRVLMVVGLLCFGLWLNNTSLLVTVSANSGPKLLAHRGVHQIYAGSDRNNDTCRAENVLPITHDLIENTIPSMRAAFEAGAEVVELDVHLTTDGEFAVFHDWTLECQTNGHGVTHKHSWEALSTLDIGYGFTSDGQNYPLRGKGHRMPTLTEVLESDLPGQFLINFKSNRTEEGVALATLLQNPDYRAKIWGIYGGRQPTRVALAELPGMLGYDKASVKACAKSYLLTGWSGYVGEACRNQIIVVPQNFAPFVWGWPHRFTQRMQQAGTTVILLGDYDGSGFSSGVEDADAWARVPARFGGFVWTNRIEVIGPIKQSAPQSR